MNKEIKYKCEIDFTCPKLNQIKSIVNGNIEDETTKQVLNNYIEELRIDIDKLRNWGHNLRKELIKLELTQNKK